MKHRITLSAEDAVCGATVATLQLCRKVALGRVNDHGGRSERTMKQRFADGIHSQMCEIAVSLVADRAWTHGGRKVSRGDISGKREVRGTDWENGCCIIYKEDDDDALVYLVIGTYPLFVVFDPIRAKQGKHDNYWNANAHPPCWFVPQDDVEAFADALRVEQKEAVEQWERDRKHG